jgi:hypothetical protein
LEILILKKQNKSMKVTYNIPKNLLSDGNSNSKTAKNLRDTMILYLAPEKSNALGVNLCPMASKGCASSCLNTAGRGKMPNVQSARLNRTHYYLQDRFTFLDQVKSEIIQKGRNLELQGLPLAIRLNGTSDAKLVEQLIASYGSLIPQNVVFYDYTKIPSKAGTKVFHSGHKYVVTLSRAEDNHDEVITHLQNDGVVAVVFDNDLPTTWQGVKVYDGDLRDDLMLDIQGPAILGLKAKGKARKDDSGFVVKFK